MRNFAVVTMLLIAMGAHAQSEDLKSAPRFFDKPRIAATAVNFSLRAYDDVNTCRGFSKSDAFRENMLPAQSCQGVTVLMAGFMAGSVVLERMLYKRHPRLARIPQLVSVAGSVQGIAFSATHRGIQ